MNNYLILENFKSKRLSRLKNRRKVGLGIINKGWIMFDKIRNANLFAKLFSFGLLLSFAGLFGEYFSAFGETGFFQFGAFPFFAPGALLCLVSLIFLLAEWVTLPYGSQSKRVGLYQGAVNLLALAMFGGLYLLIGNQQSQSFAGALPLWFASGALLIAVVFVFLGKPIAGYLCRKKISNKFIARSFSKRADGAAESNIGGRNARPLKIQKLLPGAQH